MASNDIAIKVEDVSKLYRIGISDADNDSLISSMAAFIKSPVKNFRKYRSLYNFTKNELQSSSENAQKDILWALRDVSFKVQQGEVLGIVGKNGAGKSTLLKVLTRITPPTKGKVTINGRVSSLLEVGTGFHQELTGRENVYLNGTVLGMKKAEIDRKFEEIVEFSGVEQFLDTPVKRYSSGMSVRLAFAVAAHLEPEILIIDEVLAVGDAAFQRKCINKMQDVGKEGRTVLFVSHNMPAVSSLCTKALLINKGQLIEQGKTHDIISKYLNSEHGPSAYKEWTETEKAPAGSIASLKSVKVTNRKQEVAGTIDVTKDIGLEMTFEVTKSGHTLLPHFYVFTDEGTVLFATLDQDPEWNGKRRPKGIYKSTAWIPGNLLADGRYFVTCCLVARDSGEVQFYEKQIISFLVTDNMGEGTARGDWGGDLDGSIRPLLPWTTEYGGS